MMLRILVGMGIGGIAVFVWCIAQITFDIGCIRRAVEQRRQIHKIPAPEFTGDSAYLTAYKKGFKDGVQSAADYLRDHAINERGEIKK